MTSLAIKNLPRMLYADSKGRIYDHPFYRMAGFSGIGPSTIAKGDLMPMPEFSKLFYTPDCPPVGLDPTTGEHRVVPEVELGGIASKCFAVAAFPEAGLVRTHLPAADYGLKRYHLPMWGYTAVGFKQEKYWISAFRVESNPKWDPRSYDDRKLLPAIRRYLREQPEGPLVRHLIGCAKNNHCFAAKNLFLGRWEAPMPVSRRCNSACLGCLSLQKDPSCEASHQRVGFKPSQKEIVAISVKHLEEAPEAVISFGQGCEGEPLTEHELIASSIREIRRRTEKGTINLNTNGSCPERVRAIAESGLDSIRVSLNSARKELYEAYYRPKSYSFEEVIHSIEVAKRMGLYTMVNYLVFPGITDQEEEIEAMAKLIRRTGLNFLHLKNLCIDPHLYVQRMPRTASKGIGMRATASILKRRFPSLELGYFNQPVR